MKVHSSQTQSLSAVSQHGRPSPFPRTTRTTTLLLYNAQEPVNGILHSETFRIQCREWKESFDVAKIIPSIFFFSAGLSTFFLQKKGAQNGGALSKQTKKQTNNNNNKTLLTTRGATPLRWQLASLFGAKPNPCIASGASCTLSSRRTMHAHSAQTDVRCIYTGDTRRCAFADLV